MKGLKYLQLTSADWHQIIMHTALIASHALKKDGRVRWRLFLKPGQCTLASTSLSTSQHVCLCAQVCVPIRTLTSLTALRTASIFFSSRLPSHVFFFLSPHSLHLSSVSSAQNKKKLSSHIAVTSSSTMAGQMIQCRTENNCQLL